MIRCKFVCDSITKQKGWAGAEFVYDAKFSAVTGHGAVPNSENAKFFAATPSGQLSVGSLKADNFDVGREYYLDLTAADTQTEE